MIVTPIEAREVVMRCQADLEQRTEQLSNAIRERDLAKIEHELFVLERTETLFGALERRPPEDVRRSMVTDPERYKQFVTRQSEVDRLKVVVKALADRMSGAQSVLSSLKEEWKGAGYGG